MFSSKHVLPDCSYLCVQGNKIVVTYNRGSRHNIKLWQEAIVEAHSNTCSRRRKARPWGSCYMLTTSKLLQAGSRGKQGVYSECVIRSAVGNCSVQPSSRWERSQRECARVAVRLSNHCFAAAWPKRRKCQCKGCARR